MYVEIEKAESESSKSNDELSESRKDRWIKIAIAGAEIILPLTFYAFWLVVVHWVKTGEWIW